ncbi:hypothetical protein C0Q70_11041 [Pomacea canaliculata]|uniref:Uncharacterized protein n=1 Tax=Pomacea canaliculata TaxID=400727 RepID=A0A2T7P4X9_POMCA|nr:hypothetical protein C0Q70_11041 [Pomacea canaliculata]
MSGARQNQQGVRDWRRAGGLMRSHQSRVFSRPGLISFRLFSTFPFEDCLTSALCVRYKTPPRQYSWRQGIVWLRCFWVSDFGGLGRGHGRETVLPPHTGRNLPIVVHYTYEEIEEVVLN